MKLNFKNKKNETVDSILSTFTSGINKLKALSEQNRVTAVGKRTEADTLLADADWYDAEASRAVTVVENIERLLAVPVPASSDQISA